MKRHTIDYLSLGAGLVFATLAVIYGANSAVGFTPDPRIWVPAVLVILGAAGLASAVTAQRRSDRAARDSAEDVT